MRAVTLERLKTLISEYSGVALGTYFALFGLVFAGFALALAFGFEIDSTPGGAGLLLGAWLGTKLTQPLRIGATVLLTPVVARVLKRLPARRKDAT
jgi:hypothetical protein